MDPIEEDPLMAQVLEENLQNAQQKDANFDFNVELPWGEKDDPYAVLVEIPTEGDYDAVESFKTKLNSSTRTDLRQVQELKRIKKQVEEITKEKDKEISAKDKEISAMDKENSKLKRQLQEA
ncbi:hypothetical protein FXO38_32161 [Capsicum annuum]|nr:hypothetical protein FXO38_32161 [Capsicum annuum]KAF3660966.1 hypothetical protein FXO37_13133 [Capsicum annuum]